MTNNKKPTDGLVERKPKYGEWWWHDYPAPMKMRGAPKPYRYEKSENECDDVVDLYVWVAPIPSPTDCSLIDKGHLVLVPRELLHPAVKLLEDYIGNKGQLGDELFLNSLRELLGEQPK